MATDQRRYHFTALEILNEVLNDANSGDQTLVQQWWKSLWHNLEFAQGKFYSQGTTINRPQVLVFFGGRGLGGGGNIAV